MTTNQKKPEAAGIRNVAILLGVVAVLYVAREILIPLAFAITLSMILAPVVTLLQRLGLGRVPAALLVIVVSIASAGVISWVIVNELVEVAIQLPEYRDNIHKKIDAINARRKGALGRAADSVKELGKEITSTPPTVPAVPDSSPPSIDRRARNIVPNPVNRPLAVQIVQEPANALQYLGALIKPFLRPIAAWGMVLIFSLYLLVEHNDLRNRLFRLAGLRQLNAMTQALDEAGRRVSRYLMLQFLVNICFGVLCGIGLYLIGLPYAALWGAVAAILRVVPYVGSLVAAALPLAISLAVFDGWVPPLLVFLLFGIMEVVTGNFVEPRLYAFHTGVSSLALLLSTVFWAALWGPAGLILSTPLTVCVVVLGRHASQFSFLHILLGDEAALAAEAQIYQRLLVADEPEARAVAEEYLKDHSVTELYDAVIIPALTMAEHDRHKGALDPAQEEFLFLSVKEMLADLPEALKPDSAGTDAVREPKAESPTGRVICVPANDEADEIGAAMLSQLLEFGGCAAFSIKVEPDVLQVVDVINPSVGDVICISAIPPFALSHCRSLSRQIRTRFPRTRLIVGVWGFSGDASLALERFSAPRPDQLVTTLEQALQAVAWPAKAAEELTSAGER